MVLLFLYAIPKMSIKDVDFGIMEKDANSRDFEKIISYFDMGNEPQTNQD